MSVLKQKVYKPRARVKKPRHLLKLDLNKVNKGLSIKEFDALKNNLQVSEPELCSLLSLNPRTLSRRRQQNVKFSKSESDRMLRIMKLFDLAVETIGSKSDTILWLSSPQLALDNIPPMSLLDTEIGTREVEELLFHIQYGIFS